MPFTSLTFLLFFLPVTVALSALAGRKSWRPWLLVGASLAFYTWGEGPHVLVLLLSTLGNWALGLALGSAASGRARRSWLAAGLVANVALLLLFKVGVSVVATLDALTAAAGLPAMAAHQPTGISFFTFQGMAYLLGVARGEAGVERSPARAGVLLALFPGLLAGPIVRARELQPQISASRTTTEGVALGGRRFVVGLAKKVLLADVLGRAVDEVLDGCSAGLSPSLAWFAVTTYTLQIYLDFSGYSDMAIGLARILGFTYPENFDLPYTARSVAEFWRRWHITLSAWFRDYVFLPTSFAVARRLGRLHLRPRTEAWWSYATGATLSMVLIGLWHGTTWQFAAWGGYFAALLAAERTRAGARLLRVLPEPVRQLWVLLAVMVGWVLFRTGSFALTLTILKAMLGLGFGQPSPVSRFASPEVLLVLTVGGLGALGGGRVLASRLTGWVGALAVVVLLLLCLMTLAAGTMSPFIYFRF